MIVRDMTLICDCLRLVQVSSGPESASGLTSTPNEYRVDFVGICPGCGKVCRATGKIHSWTTTDGLDDCPPDGPAHSDLAPLDLTRKDLIQADAPTLKSLILAHHTHAEAIAKLDYIRRLLDTIDRSIRDELAATMDGSYELDAYDRYTISLAKMPAKWEYDDDPKRDELIATLNWAREELRRYEDDLRARGKARDINRDRYTITLRERRRSYERE